MGGVGVKRVVCVARISVVRVAVIAGLTVSIVVAFAAPAWADVATVHGTATCSNAHRVVEWSLTNGSAAGPMSVGTASAQIGGDSFAATGFAASVASGATTSASSAVPDFATGTGGPLMLSVNVSWPNDNFSTLVYASVDLGQACAASTATTGSQPTTTVTTPSPTTTTAAPRTPTTTTPTAKRPRARTARMAHRAAKKRAVATLSAAPATRPVTTTTLDDAGPANPTSTTRPGAFTSTLAFTGSGTTVIFVFGLCLVTVGGAVVLHKRNALASLRGHETNDELRRQRDRKRRSLWVYLPPR
jgi:hypothetical protein